MLTKTCLTGKRIGVVSTVEGTRDWRDRSERLIRHLKPGQTNREGGGGGGDIFSFNYRKLKHYSLIALH